MKKKYIIILIAVLILLFTVGCVKNDENVKGARAVVEKYIEAVNANDEVAINTLVDENTVSALGIDTVYIKLKKIKHDSDFNSEDTPKERFAAFEIKYDVKYENGYESTQKKWISLEKVNDNWMIRSIAKA